jgi:hypothetical protein
LPSITINRKEREKRGQKVKKKKRTGDTGVGGAEIDSDDLALGFIGREAAEC